MKRYEGNPILSQKDIPYPAWLIFNAGVIRYHGEYLILFRNDYVLKLDGTNHGVRGGIAKIKDNFSGLEVLSLSAPDNRNMVLFPERFDGCYLRLERPFPMYSTGGEFFDIWINDSPDLRYWSSPKLLLRMKMCLSRRPKWRSHRPSKQKRAG